MAFDYKKEYKEFYLPKDTPGIVDVPEMRFVAVRGQGDPNESDGAYKRALEVLYAVAYTLKMSKLGDRRIEGYFDYVVPPLEGFWQTADGGDFSSADKSRLQWISCIRLPDFVTREDFDWAVRAASAKKKLDCSAAEYMLLREGLCIQMMHLGSYDSEPATIEAMRRYIDENGYAEDLSGARLHHEIYLSDPRKAAPEKWKTVLRHPIRPRTIVQCPPDTRLQDHLLSRDIHIRTACGGRGNCGKCAVRVIEGDAAVNTMDRVWFSQSQLEEGYRLGCQVYAKGPLTVDLLK